MALRARTGDSAQGRNRLRAHEVIHRALRKVHEDRAAFHAHFAGRSQLDLEDRVRAGGLRSVSRVPGSPGNSRARRSRFESRTPDSESCQAFSARRCATSTRRANRRPTSRSMGRTKSSRPSGISARISPPAILSGHTALMLLSRPARRTIEQREHEPPRSLDEERTVEVLVSHLDLARPPWHERLAADPRLRRNPAAPERPP